MLGAMARGEDEKPTSSSGDDYAGPTLVQKTLVHDLKATQRSAQSELPKIADSAPVETTPIMRVPNLTTGNRDPRQSPGPLIARPAAADPASSDPPYQIAYSSPPDAGEQPATPPMNAVRISPALVRMYAEEVDETAATVATSHTPPQRSSTLKSVHAAKNIRPPPATVALDPRKLFPWLLLAAVLGGAFASGILAILYLLVLRR
jgi:hypothetical protein